jgi:hypothetical protein
MKLDLCREMQQAIATRGWGQPSAEVISCCLTVVKDVCALCSSVQCSVVMPYHLSKENEWFEK